MAQELSIKVDFDPKATEQKIKSRLKKVQAVLDSQVLKDSNFYIPMESGALKNSGIENTVIGSGKIVWGSDYAKTQYYEHPNKSHQENPNAQMKWFEVAKSKRLQVWEKLVNDTYNKQS